MALHKDSRNKSPPYLLYVGEHPGLCDLVLNSCKTFINMIILKVTSKPTHKPFRAANLQHLLAPEGSASGPRGSHGKYEKPENSAAVRHQASAELTRVAQHQGQAGLAQCGKDCLQAIPSAF